MELGLCKTQIGKQVLFPKLSLLSEQTLYYFTDDLQLYETRNCPIPPCNSSFLISENIIPSSIYSKHKGPLKRTIGYKYADNLGPKMYLLLDDEYEDVLIKVREWSGCKDVKHELLASYFSSLHYDGWYHLWEKKWIMVTLLEPSRWLKIVSLDDLSGDGPGGQSYYSWLIGIVLKLMKKKVTEQVPELVQKVLEKKWIYIPMTALGIKNIRSYLETQTNLGRLNAITINWLS